MTTPETPLTVLGSIHHVRRGRGGRKELLAGTTPAIPAGRVPRVARLMALAIRFDGLIRAGGVRDYAELARLGNVTRARISQIMSLLNLASDIQEAILFLPSFRCGRDPLILSDLLPIATSSDWKKQRTIWSRTLERPATEMT
jgi:hypothetical protein